jgi:hypothetical protein
MPATKVKIRIAPPALEPATGFAYVNSHILAEMALKGLLMNELGKALLSLGLLLAFTGAVLLLGERIGLPLGRLPGDFAYKGKNVSVYFPLGTCILISIVLSAVLYLFSLFRH